LSKTPAAYAVRTDKLDLTLAILDISSLYIHEETIPQFLQHLTSSIAADGYVKDPIIVDKKTLTVLDGVHRVAALKKLRIPRIPACLVDYNNPNIEVSNWYRTITDTSSLEATIRTLKLPHVTIETDPKLNISNVGTSPNAAAIKLRNTTFLIKSRFTNIGEAYDIIEKIESRLRSNRLRIRYETGTDALQDLATGSVDAVMCTPKLTKKKIVDLALSGTVLAAKTTRHVIPARPMRLNVPVSLLKSDKKPLRETNKELRNLLQRKRLRTLPPGTVLDGRRYEEELYVFEESS
jgi:hypothetical protein